MTLYRQLVAGMTAVFLLLVIFVLSIEFKTTQGYLIQQQYSEMNNTTNTIGLALSPYLESGDHVAAESVINALFDGSSYSMVKLRFLDDNTEIVRSYDVVANGVPDWFTSLDFLPKLHEKRIVTSGWLQLAEVEIVSHPGDAYEQLWEAFVQLIITFIGTFAAGLISIAYLLSKALKPLRLITNKMIEIANNNFGKPLKTPATKDLVAVVDGINFMSNQVEKSFKAQAQEAQKLRERAYMDPVSQLGNRSFFMAQLNQWLNESAKGGIAILQTQFIKEAYEESGYEAGDNLIKELADNLKITTTLPSVIMARISTDEFGFIFPDVDETELKVIADNIVHNVKNVKPQPDETNPEESCLGLVYNEKRKSASDMLSLVDNALTKAHSEPELEYGFVTEQSGQVTLGKQQWRTLVEEAINTHAVEFKFQPAKKADKTTFHLEVFSSIKLNGMKYTANQYLFALEQLNSGYIFDQYVIGQMIDKLTSGEITDSLAINLTVSSITDAGFIRWLTKTLGKNRHIANKLHFEIPETCFIHHQHHTALLCHAVRTSGSEFGVDNYGRHFHSLEYIHEFRPGYVKLDYLYTHHIEDEKQRFTLTSISRTAYDQDIITIASRVETQSQLDFLSSHYIEAFQGFIVSQ